MRVLGTALNATRKNHKRLSPSLFGQLIPIGKLAITQDLMRVLETALNATRKNHKRLSPSLFGQLIPIGKGGNED